MRKWLTGLGALGSKVFSHDKDLYEIEERFSQLVEAIEQVFWIATADKSKLLYVSNRVEKILGDTPEALIAGFPDSLFKRIIPEDVPALNAALARRLDRRDEVTYRIRHDDGTIRWITAQSFPVRNKRGFIYRLAGILTDITAQKKREDEIRLSEEKLQIINCRFRQLAENTQDVFWVSTKEKVLYVSPAFENVWGRPVADVLADKDLFFESIYPDDKAAIEKFIEDKKSSPQSVEYRIVRPDGEIRWIRDRSCPILLGAEGTSAGIAEDFTERKKAEMATQAAKDEAERANKAKSAFLANVTHEIRNPLGAVLGFAEMLKEPNLDEATRQEFLGIILKSGRSLERLINDMLDLSRIEARQMLIEKTSVNVASLCEDVVSLYSQMALAKKVALTYSIHPAVPCHILTDCERTKQILSNLLSNGIKFSENGRVEMRVSSFFTIGTSEIMVKFEVSDTGIGISSDEQGSLFKPFSQANPEIFKQYGGTGLGLALSRHLARALGGELRLLKSCVGEGSTFTFTLASGLYKAPKQLSPLPITQALQPSGRQIVPLADKADRPLRH